MFAGRLVCIRQTCFVSTPLTPTFRVFVPTIAPMVPTKTVLVPTFAPNVPTKTVLVPTIAPMVPTKTVWCPLKLFSWCQNFAQRTSKPRFRPAGRGNTPLGLAGRGSSLRSSSSSRRSDGIDSSHSPHQPIIGTSPSPGRTSVTFVYANANPIRRTLRSVPSPGLPAMNATRLPRLAASLSRHAISAC